MSLTSLREIADARLRGGLGTTDAKALIEAAGQGPAAAKRLQKILAEYADSFTAKGRAVIEKVVGGSRPSRGEVTEITRKALMKSFGALGLQLGQSFPSLPVGSRFVEVPLMAEKRPFGFAYSAMVSLGPVHSPKDPNEAASFFIKRTGGPGRVAQYFGSFDLAKSGKVTKVVIDKDDAGKTIKVKKGQDLVVELPSNITTGHKWLVTSTDRSFGYPVKDEYLAANAPGRIGGGGTQRLSWKTDQPYIRTGGSHRVELSYARSAADEPADTFSFSVKIV